MKRWKASCIGLVALAGLTPSVLAQPAVAPAPAAAAAPIVPAGPPQPALLNAIGLGPDQIAACKAKLCASCIGQMFSGFTRILSGFSGGCIPPCCPPLPPLPAGAGGAAGEAAKIQAELAKCPDEVKAIRYLATLDCHYFPQAGDAIAGALRQSRCECVRLEAARALGTGCCCNQVTIKALAYCVAGSHADGNPSETSERVRAAAYFALEHCLACVGGPREPPAAPPERPPERPPEGPRERAPAPKPGEVTKEKLSAELAAYARQTNDDGLNKVVVEARRVIELSNLAQGAVVSQGSHGLFDIMKNSMGAHTTSEGVPAGAVESEGVPVESVTPVPTQSIAVMPAPGPMPVVTQPMAPSGPPATLTVYPKSEIGSGAPGAPTSYTIYPMTPPRTVTVPAPTRIEPVPEMRTPMVISAPRAEPQPVIITPHVAPAPTVEHLPAVVTPRIESAPAPLSAPQSRAPVPEPTARPVVHYEQTGPTATPGLPTQYTQQQLVMILKNSSYPWQREWAVQNLAGTDARSNPEVVQLVLTTAQHDAAAPVRASAIRCLVHMQVHTVALVNTLQALRADSDPRVRQEAESALIGLARPHTSVVSQTPVGFTPAGN